MGAGMDPTYRLIPSGLAAANRIETAFERLNATDAGRHVLRSIEHHGGLERWYLSGPLHFRFRYAPSGGTVIDSEQDIDVWSSRARHQIPGRPDLQFGWDGTQAWAKPGLAAIGVNPRFWALTPFYFIAIPFVLADDGVVLAYEGQTELEGRTYDLVRATYETGVGDSPEDFYVAYIDAETGRIGGVRYIVSYPGFFPDGGHSPERLMIYDGSQEVDGIRFAINFRTYSWDGNRAVDPAATAELTEIRFRPELEPAHFNVPRQSEILEGYGER